MISMENPERLTPAERRELVKGNRRVGFAVRGREAVEGAHADLSGPAARRHIGYGAIGAEHAEAFQKFYTACCNPCLHYHRPCGLATVKILARGKRKRSCPVEDYRPP